MCKGVTGEEAREMTGINYVVLQIILGILALTLGEVGSNCGVK